VCEQCQAETKTYGQVAPGWWLIQATKDGDAMKSGDFGLVRINDPEYIWPATLVLTEDPGFGLEHDDAAWDAATAAHSDQRDRFVEGACELMPHLDGTPASGYNLVLRCMDAGYTKKCGYFHMWLAGRVAQVIARNPTACEKVGDEWADRDEAAWGYTRQGEYGHLHDRAGQTHPRTPRVVMNVWIELWWGLSPSRDRPIAAACRDCEPGQTHRVYYGVGDRGNRPGPLGQRI
jgi:hypothetical protein